MKYSRIPLHKAPTAARTIGAARPTFSKTRPHIAPNTVSKSIALIRRPFIRYTTPKPRLSPLRVNAANPSAVSAARVNTANPSAVSAARVKAARLSVVNAARINVVKSSVVTAVRHNHTKKVWRPKTLVLDHENQSNPTADFQDTEKAREEGTHTYVLFSVLSDGSTNPKNNKDAHTGGNEHNDDIQKSVSPSCGDQAKEQGDKAVNKDKGKSHVVTITRFRDLNEEYAECINNSSNGVSAVGPSVSTAGLEFTNSTNDFTTAGPLVSAAKLNFINSTNDFSAAGPSNAAMPNLEDFSHNEDNVGAEADTNNMESIISISPIPTTRTHKYHPTSQIIGDLSSTTQTRSMARGV
nr:hypothetical protein [Tanacetum cinerariifolium]